MAIVLNGVTLSASMIWADRHKHAPVAQSALTTLGGGVIVYSQTLVEGRPITLEARIDTGWITKAMLDQLEAMAAIAGGVYTIDIHGFAANVMFRHQDAPAVEFEPLTPKATPVAGDYYVGTLKLFTV